MAGWTMSVTVAVVEDDELIRTMLRFNLESEGYRVEAFSSGADYLRAMAERRHDVILLDIMLPGLQGGEVLERIRRRGPNPPVLMLTARRDLESRVGTLDGGADDYLAKPFEMPELVARVRALIRRSQGERHLPTDRRLRIGLFEVDLDSRTAQTQTGPIDLSEREAALLELFARNPGRTLSRTDILEDVWGLETDPTPRTVDNFIVRLRRLFETDPAQPRHFITVRSEGYRFEPDAQEDT
jgi:DNA-binding response OmpR family regulator